MRIKVNEVGTDGFVPKPSITKNWRFRTEIKVVLSCQNPVKRICLYWKTIPHDFLLTWYVCFSRVAQGNLTPTLPQIRTWQSPVIRLLSSSRWLKNRRPCFTHWFLPFLVDQKVKPDDVAPSLQPHYRAFFTTTSYSAPVLRIGTLILVGPPLEFLP